MDKRERELFKTIERLGLSVVRQMVGRHRKLTVQRRDGESKLIVASISPSDTRAQHNMVATLRRFAEGNLKQRG